LADLSRHKSPPTDGLLWNSHAQVVKLRGSGHILTRMVIAVMAREDKVKGGRWDEPPASGAWPCAGAAKEKRQLSGAP
jgi:hypothetical protein